MESYYQYTAQEMNVFAIILSLISFLAPALFYSQVARLC